MNEVLIQLPVLGMLSTAQSVLRPSVLAASDFAAAALSVAAALVLLLSNKPVKRSHVLSLKAGIRGLFLTFCVSAWAYGISSLGAARSVLLNVCAVLVLSLTKDKVLDIVSITTVGAAVLIIALTSPNLVAVVVLLVSAVSRDMFTLFRDHATLFVGCVASLCIWMMMHLLFSSLNVHTDPLMTKESRSISLSWTAASAVLWILPVSLAPSYEEKWNEFSQNKKNQLVFSITCAGMAAFLEQELHPIGFIVALGLAVATILRKKTKVERSILPTTVRDTGLSQDMDTLKKQTLFPLRWRIPFVSVSQFANFIRDANANPNSRKILQFLMLTLTFMFVELGVGLFTGSLGLISDAGHMFFDSAALFIGLFAAYAARWRPDNMYTYGYGRFETIAGFINAVFLAFVAVFVLTESLERFSEPPTIRTEGLLLTSVLGLAVNGIGLVYFHEHAHSHAGDHGHSHAAPKVAKGKNSSSHGHSHESHTHTHSHEHGHSHSHNHAHNQHGHSHDDNDECDHGHSHNGRAGGHHHGTNENMHGVFLHVLADALGSVGVIISSLLVQYKQWYIADPICSFLISILIGISVIPLLKSTASSLLLRIPSDLEPQFDSCLEKLKRKPGVVRVVQAHLWRLSQEEIIATISVVVKSKEVQDGITSWLVSTLKNECAATEVTVQVITEELSREIR